jgi:hypothetical protein
VRIADSPPSSGAPLPPAGFQPPTSQGRGGRRNTATAQQVRDAIDVARELDHVDYAKDFGPHAPPQKTFTDALRLAKAWSNELAAAERWLVYVKAQYEGAWTGTLVLAKKLEPEFRHAARNDPTIAERYPQTLDFLDVRRAAAAKAATTRARNKGRKATKTP